MSAKQIRFFGTPAQKARVRGARKRANSSRSNHRRRSRSNKGEIIGYTFAQPARKNKGRTHMAATKTSKKARRARYRKARANRVRKNAPRHHYYKHRRKVRMNRGRRRNPGMLGTGRLSSIAINAVFVIVGAVGSKLLAQMVLGTNNTGVVGYAANAIAGGAMWFVAEKVMHNTDAANGIIAGTAVEIILRLINDYTPFGSYVAGLGMGDYQAQAWLTPQVLVDPYKNANIQWPQGLLSAVTPPPAVAMPASVGIQSGMGDLYGGKSSLY
jgi:hypothetical protein